MLFLSAILTSQLSCVRQKGLPNYNRAAHNSPAGSEDERHRSSLMKIFSLPSLLFHDFLRGAKIDPNIAKGIV